MWPLYLSLIGCAIGAGMGAYAMVNPRWAARLVRLRDDPERPGGAAEFRGTYGGLFLAVHAVAAFFAWNSLQMADAALGAHVAACAVAAAVWWGTAIGRALSILADRTGGQFNYVSVGFEIALGAMIAAPLLFGVSP